MGAEPRGKEAPSFPGPELWVESKPAHLSGIPRANVGGIAPPSKDPERKSVTAGETQPFHVSSPPASPSCEARPQTRNWRLGQLSHPPSMLQETCG